MTDIETIERLLENHHKEIGDKLSGDLATFRAGVRDDIAAQKKHLLALIESQRDMLLWVGGIAFAVGFTAGWLVS